MSSRLRRIAEVNEEAVARGRYTAVDGSEVLIGDEVEAAASGTRCYGPEEPLGPPPTVPQGGGRQGGDGPLLQVTGEGSLEAARRMCGEREGEVAVLNFASARNPGGGYLGGAKAQEEDLCRQALLHTCLLRAPEYYAAHRADSDLLYSDRVIWSPRVPVHRRADGELSARPLLVSFLTSPAPNAGEVLRRDPAAGERIRAALRRRAGRVLGVAAQQGVRRLVLGAWGCGVFRNDPREVAEAFHVHLGPGGGYRPAFDEVVFAILDRAGTGPSANRRAFDDRFPDDRFPDDRLPDAR